MRCCFCRRRKDPRDDDDYVASTPVVANRYASGRDDDADKNAVAYMRSRKSSKAEDEETHNLNGNGSADFRGEGMVKEEQASGRPRSDPGKHESTSLSDKEDVLEETDILLDDSVVADSRGERTESKEARTREDNPSLDSFLNEDALNHCRSSDQEGHQHVGTECNENDVLPANGSANDLSDVVENFDEGGSSSSMYDLKEDCSDEENINQRPPNNTENACEPNAQEISSTIENCTSDAGDTGMDSFSDGDVNVEEGTEDPESLPTCHVGDVMELSTDGVKNSEPDAEDPDLLECAKHDNDSTSDGGKRAENEMNEAELASEGSKKSIDANEISNAGVNSATSERYAKACELLRRSLFQHEKSLTSAERTFLVDLIESSSSVAPRDEKIAEIESASDVLESNVLFKSTPGEERPATDLERNSEADIKPVPPNNTVNRVSRQGKYKKNRVELSVSDKSSEIEVSQLRSGSVGSNGSSLQTVNERNSSSKLSSESILKANNNFIQKEDITDAPCQDSNGVFNEEQPSKKQKVDAEERFDGWGISEQEHKLEDDESDLKSFFILGTSADDESAKPHVLSPLVMEAMRGFLPLVVSEENFWMKYSLVRDGASLLTLQRHVRASNWTIIAIETVEGDVFGSFTGAPWREQPGYFGSRDAFLWRLKKSRWSSQARLRAMTSSWIDSEMEVYPHTGQDSLLQLCNADCIALGGGPWKFGESPYLRDQLGVGLRIEADLLRGESKSSGTFANPPLCRSCEDEPHEFEIMNLEAWTLTPCFSVEEAEKLELRKLFIEEHKNHRNNS
mmetsp:Transcript_10445/g.30706  ORF Transcript_10445/g.30706 Transcript_10445/m.30706 type:complete len:797 (-) Transcript_10445:89-2479(-)